MSGKETEANCIKSYAQLIAEQGLFPFQEIYAFSLFCFVFPLLGPLGAQNLPYYTKLLSLLVTLQSGVGFLFQNL